MLEMIISAFIGSALAGLHDLKTTEVPDDIPALMVAAGIFYWFVFALTFGDFYPLFLSLSFGTLLLAVGLLMYRFGQWGEADAWLLAATAYMIPLYNGIFMLSFVVNFFIVGAVYNVVYAAALGARHRSVLPYFVRDMKGNARLLLVPLAFLFLAIILHTAYSIDTASLFYASLLFLFLLVFWRYGKIIETKIFRKKIASRHLKEGDVIGPLWRGLTKEEITDIRKRHKYVVVKEGVRFVPVFPITLVVTLIYGNLIFTLFPF